MSEFDPTIRINNNINNNILKARSPIILSFEAGGAGTTFSNATLTYDIYTWNGTKSSKPTTSTAQIELPATSYNSGDKIQLDIKDYVKNQIEANKFGYDSNDATWVDVEANFTYTIGTVSGNSFSASYSYVGVNGFATYKNDDKEAEMLYVPSDTILIPEGRTHTITILDKGIIGTRDFDNLTVEYNNNTIATYSLPSVPADPNTSDLFIEYDVLIPVDATEGILKTFLGTSSTPVNTVTFKQTCPKKYDIFEIGFYDKNGAVSYLWTTANSQESSNFESEEYRPIFDININGQYNETKSSIQRYNINGKGQIVFNTDFVPQSYDQVVKELMLTEYSFLRDEDESSISNQSIYEYLISEGFTIESESSTTNLIEQLGGNINQFNVNDTSFTYVTYPIIPKDSSITYQKHITEKVINYQLTFDRGYDEINNIF